MFDVMEKFSTSPSVDIQYVAPRGREVSRSSAEADVASRRRQWLLLRLQLQRLRHLLVHLTPPLFSPPTYSSLGLAALTSFPSAGPPHPSETSLIISRVPSHVAMLELLDPHKADRSFLFIASFQCVHIFYSKSL